MEITFNDHTFEVRSKKVKGETLWSLKDIENGWKLGKPEGASDKTLHHWSRGPDIIELVQLGEIRLIKSRGKSGGTWGCIDAVIEYASHCSIPFRAAVRNTFKKEQFGVSRI